MLPKYKHEKSRSIYIQVRKKQTILNITIAVQHCPTIKKLNSNKGKNLSAFPVDLLICLEKPKYSNEKSMGQIIKFIKLGQL